MKYLQETLLAENKVYHEMEKKPVKLISITSHVIFWSFFQLKKYCVSWCTCDIRSSTYKFLCDACMYEILIRTYDILRRT